MWQAICCVEQLSWQLVLIVEFVVGVAVLGVIAEVIGVAFTDAPGTTQVVWQAAACELHVIMQLVTVELCAKRIFPALATAVASMAAPHPNSASKIKPRPMTASHRSATAAS